MASLTTTATSRAALQIATALGALVLIGVIIWIDISTTIWQDMVILAGLAAGLVSFLLTTVFVNRFLQRQLEARWAPVTHMALTSILHELADENRSDLNRGHIAPRTLTAPRGLDTETLRVDLDQLRSQVLSERNHLSGVLGTWSNFLTSTVDNTDILRSAAELALQLDQVRDTALDVEHHLNSAEQMKQGLQELETHIETCNRHHATLINDLHIRKSANAAQRAQIVAKS